MNKSKNENLMVIVIDKHKKPLGFTSEKRAKQLLENGNTVIHCFFPFVIRLKNKNVRDCHIHEYKIKIDPESKYTGISITDLNNNVYLKANMIHRAQSIISDLEKRRGNRRNRRNRKTRYRRCKYKYGQDAQSSRHEGCYLHLSFQLNKTLLIL